MNMEQPTLPLSVNGHEFSEPLALLYFSANWCGPCQQMTPVAKEFATQQSDKIKVLKIDVDQQAELSNQFGVRAVPTLVLLDRNGVIDRQTGSASLQQLNHWIEKSTS